MPRRRMSNRSSVQVNVSYACENEARHHHAGYGATASSRLAHRMLCRAIMSSVGESAHAATYRSVLNSYGRRGNSASR